MTKIGTHPCGVVGDVGTPQIALGHLVDHNDQRLMRHLREPVERLLQDGWIGHDDGARLQCLARRYDAYVIVPGQSTDVVVQRPGHVLVVTAVLEQRCVEPGRAGRAYHVERGFLRAAKEVEIADEKQVMGPSRRPPVGAEAPRGGKERRRGAETAGSRTAAGSRPECQKSLAS